MMPKHLMSAGVLLVAAAIGVIALRDGKDHLTATVTGGSGAVVNPHSKSARGPSPPTAFFKVLDGKESVAHCLDRWDAERWSSTEAQQKFVSYKAQMESDRGTVERHVFVQEPVEEGVAAGAALTLAEHNVEGAVTLLSKHGLNCNHVVNLK